MNWKSEAIEKLEELDAKKQALSSIPQEIKRLDMEMSAIKGGFHGGVRGGGKREDALLSMLVKKEELTRLLDQTKLWVSRVEQGLGRMADEELRLLEQFYIYPTRGAAERLADELMVDVKTVYRRKDAAVRKFTLSLYGAMEG